MNNLDLQILTPEGYYESVDMPATSSLSMEDNNPLFAKQFLEGTFSLPLTLPPTPKNQRLFGYAELVHIANRPTTKVKARLYGQGLPLPDGEVILRSAGNKGYRINFQSKTSLLTTAFNGLKLRDLPYVSIELVKWDADNTHWTQAGGAKYLTIVARQTTDIPNPVRVSINGNDFESDTTDDVAARIASLVLKIQQGGYFAAGGVRVNPYPYTGDNAFLDVGLLEFGLDPKFEVSADPVWVYTDSWVRHWNHEIELALQVYYAKNTSVKVYPSYDALFPTMRNPSHFADNEDAHIKADINAPNEFTEITKKNLLLFDKKFDSWESNRVNRGLVPHFRLWNVMQALQRQTGIHISERLDYVELFFLIFVNTHALNYFENIFNDNVVSTFVPVINPADHLPDMTVNELFAELRLLFGIGYNFNEDSKTLLFVRLPDILNVREYIDYTKKTHPDYQLDYKENPGVLLGYKGDDGDVIDAPGTITVGSGKEDYRSSLGYVEAQTVLSDSHFPQLYKIPVFDLPGSWSGEKSEFKAMIAFYHGEKDFGGTYKYMFASHDNYDGDGNKLLDVSLAMEDEGIYETYLRKLGDILAYNDPETRILYWTMADLTEFRYTQKYRIDQVNYMIKKLSYTISSSSGLQPITAEIIRVD